MRSSNPIRSPRIAARRSGSGVALLMTMIVVVLYAILATQFIYTTTVYGQLLNNNRDAITGEWIARGGITRARALLKLDDQLEYDSLNEDWAQPLVYEEGDTPEGASPEVVITDEERKFNVRLLVWEDATQEQEERIREVFEDLIVLLVKEDERAIDHGVDEYGNELRPDSRFDRPRSSDIRPAEIYDGIRRYITEREDEASDDATFEKGEKDGRVRKQSPYSLLTIRELLFAEDITEEVLLGRQFVRDKNIKGNGDGSDGRDDEERRDYWDENEYDPQTGERLSDKEIARAQSASNRVQADIDAASSPEPEPLEKYLTLWGDGRININTADRLVILALSKALTKEMVRDIITARDEARQDRERIDAGTEADPVDEPVSPTLEDEGIEEEEDQSSFRLADIANVVSFYNRVYQNLAAADGEEEPEAVTDESQVPEEWREAFEDMRPFLTVRSTYFRVSSKITIERTTKHFEAVFRRDQTQASADANNANNGNGNGNNLNPNGGANAGDGTNETPQPTSSLTGRSGDPGLPPEPNLLLRLIYMNEVE